RIAGTTKFNGQALLDGAYNGTFQVGANTSAADKISVNLKGGSMGAVGLGVQGVDVTAVAANARTGVITSATAGAGGSVLVNGDFTTVAAFDGLNGTVTFGDKSLDLSSVKVEAGADLATRTTALQTAVTAAFGTDVTATLAAGGLTFTGQ